MGTEISIPCTEAKASQAISQGKKYEVTLPKEKESKFAKDFQNKYSSKIEMHQGDLSCPKVTRLVNCYQFTDEFHEEEDDSPTLESTADQGPQIVICSSEITSFTGFMDDISTAYENVSHLSYE